MQQSKVSTNKKKRLKQPVDLHFNRRLRATVFVNLRLISFFPFTSSTKVPGENAIQCLHVN